MARATACSTASNLVVRPGEKVGIVGPSGAGKTTLANLILRLYDLEGGRILIDGQDISAVTQNSLRGQIGVVSQDTALFHRSLRDNIGSASPTRRTPRSSPPPARPRRTSSSLELQDNAGRPATTPSSASAASSCRAASASAWRSRASSSRTRRS